MKSEPPSAEPPLQMKNALRGAADPYARVLTLRQQVEPSQFPQLVDWLATFGMRSPKVSASRRSTTLKSMRSEERFAPPIHPRHEIAWAAAYIVRYADHLQKFVDSSAYVSRLILIGEIGQALELFDSIERSWRVVPLGRRKAFFPAASKRRPGTAESLPIGGP